MKAAQLCAAGADRQPELLQHIFSCLSGVLRHLAQWLAAGLPGVLQETAPLRCSSARHVRQLAAQSMGFLLRHARGKALRSGVRTIYAGTPLVLGGKYFSLLQSLVILKAHRAPPYAMSIQCIKMSELPPHAFGAF